MFQYDNHHIQSSSSRSKSITNYKSLSSIANYVSNIPSSPGLPSWRIAWMVSWPFWNSSFVVVVVVVLVCEIISAESIV